MDDLKYQGLLERVAKLVARYEDEIAGLRVELTNMSAQLDSSNKKIEKLENMLEQDSEEYPVNDSNVS